MVVSVYKLQTHYPIGDTMKYDAEILFQRKRIIAARREVERDSRSTDVVEHDWLKECFYNSMIRRGPECGTKKHSRCASHHGKAPRGISGHRYPSANGVRPQIVRNAEGKNVVIAA